jgi:O-antigen/teichoic acid export membrane protein
MPDSSQAAEPQRSLGRIVLKNTVAVTAGSAALKAINFLFNVYVVRRLGDDRFGQYSIVLGFVGLFQIFAELGISQYVMREIARDRRKAPGFFWNLVTVRLLLALLGIVGITLGAAAYGYSSELVLGVFLFTCNFLLAALLAPLKVLLTANERLDYVTAVVVVGQVAFVLLGSVFLFGGLGYLWLIVAGLLSILPQIALAAWAARRHHLLSFPFQLDARTWPGLMRAGLPFGIISLTLSIAFSIDTVMMSRLLPEHVIGWYNVAYGLVFSIVSLSGGFQTAIVPSLTRAYASDPVAVQRWYYRSVKYGLILSLPIAVGGTLLAFPLIRFLYTDEFLPAALALQILIWDVPLLMFTSFCGDMTTIISEERAAARIYALNALANVLLNLYAIPRFGLVGAALVTVITDLIGVLQFHLLLKRKLKLPNMTWTIARVAAAAALMGGGVYWLGRLNLFVLIGLGGAVYGLLALAFQLIDRSEWALILRLARWRGPAVEENPAP